MIYVEYVLLMLFGYFVGNISWARIISKAKHDDITKHGSGNPGSTNMLRTYGAKIGFLTLFLDVVKGAIPALAGLLLFKYTGLNQDIGLYVGGLSVILGHMFPVIYKFKGGKSVACTIGVFMVANPLWLLVAFLVAFLYVWFFDYVSVASLFIVAFMSAIQGYYYSKTYADSSSTLVALDIILFAIFSLVWFAHRTNIVRLLLGKENKANLQKSLKKELSKQKKEEYKSQKSELNAEFKKLKAQYKKEKRSKKQELKTEYISAKESLHGTNADILASQIKPKEDESLQTDAVESSAQNQVSNNAEVEPTQTTNDNATKQSQENLQQIQTANSKK